MINMSSCADPLEADETCLMFSSECSAIQVIYRNLCQGMSTLPVAASLEKMSVPIPMAINLPIAPQGGVEPLELHPDPRWDADRPNLVEVSKGNEFSLNIHSF